MAEVFERSELTRRSALGLGFGALAATAAPAAQQSATAWSAVDEAAAKAVADRLIPGMAVSAMRDGRMLYSRGFGLANIETQTPVTPLSVFRIGSNAKQFTAAAILLLAEQGKLGLDDPLARYVPEVPRAAEISLAEMLSHTSGLGNYTSGDKAAVLKAARTDYDQAGLLTEMLETRPLYAFEPGTGWAYSNTAYVFLGIVIERVTKRPYGEVIRDGIIRAAGLTKTAVDADEDVVIGRVSGYVPDAKAPTGFVNAPFISMNYPGAGGAMRSTSDDLCRWHHALLGGRVLSQKSLARMMTPARLRDGQLPTSTGGAGKPKAVIRYGLGTYVGDDNGRPFIEHTGGMFGFLSILRSELNDRHSLAVIVNTDGGEQMGKVIQRINAVRAAAKAAAG